jgi:hypothetical protein
MVSDHIFSKFDAPPLQRTLLPLFISTIIMGILSRSLKGAVVASYPTTPFNM